MAAPGKKLGEPPHAGVTGAANDVLKGCQSQRSPPADARIPRLETVGSDAYVTASTKYIGMGWRVSGVNGGLVGNRRRVTGPEERVTDGMDEGGSNITRDGVGPSRQKPWEGAVNSGSSQLWSSWWGSRFEEKPRTTSPGRGYLLLARQSVPTSSWSPKLSGSCLSQVTTIGWWDEICP